MTVMSTTTKVDDGECRGQTQCDDPHSNRISFVVYTAGKISHSRDHRSKARWIITHSSVFHSGTEYNLTLEALRQLEFKLNIIFIVWGEKKANFRQKRWKY